MVDFLHTVREIFFLNQPQNDFSSAHPRTDNIGCVPESFAWLLSWSFFCFVFAWNSYELVERHGVICIRPFFFSLQLERSKPNKYPSKSEVRVELLAG